MRDEPARGLLELLDDFANALATPSAFGRAGAFFALAPELFGGGAGRGSPSDLRVKDVNRADCPDLSGWAFGGAGSIFSGVLSVNLRSEVGACKLLDASGISGIAKATASPGRRLRTGDVKSDFATGVTLPLPEREARSFPDLVLGLKVWSEVTSPCSLSAFFALAASTLALRFSAHSLASLAVGAM